MGLHGDQHVASTVPYPTPPPHPPPAMTMKGLAGRSHSTILRCILLHLPHKSGVLVFKQCTKYPFFPTIRKMVSRGAELIICSSVLKYKDQSWHILLYILMYLEEMYFGGEFMEFFGCWEEKKLNHRKDGCIGWGWGLKCFKVQTPLLGSYLATVWE